MHFISLEDFANSLMFGKPNYVLGKRVNLMPRDHFDSKLVELKTLIRSVRMNLPVIKFQ